MKIYGKKGKSVFTSNSYNTSIELETSIQRKDGMEEKGLAFGKWDKHYFTIFAKSCIKKQTVNNYNQIRKNIIDELIQDEAFIEDVDSEYYVLKQDILLHSPSAAADLVHGNERNGRNDWMYDRMSFGDLNKSD